MSNEKRLYRSRTDHMVSGVCAGVAEYFDIDPTLVRLGFVLLVFLTGGSLGLALPLIYLAMAIVIPEAPENAPTQIVDVTPAPATEDTFEATAVAEAE